MFVEVKLTYRGKENTNEFCPFCGVYYGTESCECGARLELIDKPMRREYVWIKEFECYSFGTHTISE